MDNGDDGWLADAKDALDLRLVHADQTHSKPFKPEFLYPIFGDDETIYGYKQLDIKLHFASGSLSMFLEIGHASKLKEQPGVAADDIEGTLYKFIPPDYSKNLATFNDIVIHDQAHFRPCGELVGGYRRKTERPGVNGKGKGKEKTKNDWEIVLETSALESEEIAYVAYKSTWETPGFREYHRRMQIFVLLYIEGGTFIDEEDPRWEFLTLYERRKQAQGAGFSYHFVGYSSWYSFLCWPDRVRLRLSQFIILPPYQRAGHGGAFYALAYGDLMQQSQVAELSIEDPSESCQDLRDKVDLDFLIAQGLAKQVSAPLKKGWVAAERARWKLGERQFARLLEMILMLKEKELDAEGRRAFRLGVKERLYRFNYEMLSQLEKDERHEKLHIAFEDVIGDYRRICGSRTIN